MSARRQIHETASATLRSDLFLHDIERSIFDFKVRLLQILTDSTEAEHLDTADEKDDADKRRPAAGRITERDLTDDRHNDHHERDKAEQNARDRSDLERCCRECNDTVQVHS